MDKTVLKVIGWTLVAAAVLLHFSVCRWDEPFGSDVIFFFVYARQNVPLPVAGVLGLVLPALAAGTGFAFITRANKKR